MSNQEFSGLGLNHTLYILKKDQEEGEWIDGENCEEERWIRDFPDGSVSKESACSAGDPALIPEQGRSPGEGNGKHSSILAWKIPWTEEPGGWQSIGLQELDMT